MKIGITCGCGKKLFAPATAAGKKAQCPHCRAVLTVPQPPDDSGDAELFGTFNVAPPEPLPNETSPAWRGQARAPAAATTGRSSAPGTATAPQPRTATATTRAPFSPPAFETPAPRGPSYWRCWLFMLTLVPLAFSLLSIEDNYDERLLKTLQENPQVKELVDQGASDEAIFAALPAGQIVGAHLPRDTYVHWLYALLSAAGFLTVICLLFDRGEATSMNLVLVGLATATGGVLLLLTFQWIAEFTQHFWLRGANIVTLLFYVVKLIGYSYRAASDPSNGFWLSMLGFTVGVGLCEEFVKALPVLVKIRGETVRTWRTACAWGLGSGVGFGVAEGIMYSADYYNGLQTGEIYLVRFISCVALHAIWTGTAALFLWRRRDEVTKDADLSWFGDVALMLAPVIVLHGLYDTLLKREMNGWALVVALASFALFMVMLHPLLQPEDEEEEEDSERWRGRPLYGSG